MKLNKYYIYRLTRQIPKGRATTYGTLAKAAGNPKAARGVGTLMHVNPDAPHILCHRVVKSDGTIGGYGSLKGAMEKIERLKAEGVEVANDKIINFRRKLFDDFKTDVN